MKLNRHTQACYNEHMGHWMMDDNRFHQLYNFIMGENITFEAVDDDEFVQRKPQAEMDAEIAPITSGGVMVVPITGTMMRGQSSMHDGTSTVQIRRILRSAAVNPKVSGVMLRVDSPGGTVAGNDDLANEIRNFGQQKPIVSHVDSLMASAAYWAGSQTSKITASRTSEIGSLGTVAVVRDFSENLEKQGIKTHVISTGPHKGAFTPGSEVTKEHLADLQATVNGLNEFFKEAVQSGRGMDSKAVDKLFDGRCHMAEDAKKLGLIDDVMSFETALSNFENEVFDEDDGSEARARLRLARRRV